MGSKVRGCDSTVGGLVHEVEFGSGRALAAALVVVGAVILGVVPAAIVLGVARLQLEQLATELGSVAAVVGGVKLVAAASGIVGRLWAEHTARLATASLD
jgi:hypothetical protein